MRPRHLYLAAAISFAVTLAFGYFYGRDHDIDAYVSWQLATGGLRPWEAYAVENNYPPVTHYFLTLVEAARRALGIDPHGRLNHLLLKVPNLLAQFVGAYALLRTLGPRLGTPRAVGIAMTWAVSLNFFGNVVWGQFDVLVSLFLLLAMLAVLRGKLFVFGLWLGVALATKIQIVFAMPIAAVWLIARTGARGTLIATAGGIVGLAVTFAPMAVGGRLREATGVYGASVGTLPERSNDAWNVWDLANGVEVKLLGKPTNVVDLDTRLLVPGLSDRLNHRHLGIAMFLGYLTGLAVLVARRRTTRSLVIAVPLAGVAMFMLATEMCQRYITPPAALMVLWLLLDDRRLRWQFLYWTVSAGVNTLVSLIKFNDRTLSILYYAGGAIFGTANVLMFAWLTWIFLTDRDRAGETSALDFDDGSKLTGAPKDLSRVPAPTL